jgi:hypothetical protein
MVEAYVILGNADVRKSSTVRALTGAGMHGQREVATNAGNINVWIEIRALQEIPVLSSEFIRTVNSSRLQYTLFPLRIDEVRHQHQTYPQGVEYIRIFIAAAGWTIRDIFVLGAAEIDGLPSAAPNPTFIPQSGVTPANQIAAQIRGQWAWL